MANQRIIAWKTNRDFRGKAEAPEVVDLSPTALAKTHPALAKAIGGGRVTSHAVQYWEHGLLITLVVDY